MYRKNVVPETTIERNEGTEGEWLNEKIKRFANNNEPIQAETQIIFTARQDGVRPEHDIRTDRFELAVDATDYITGSQIANRQNNLKIVKDEPDEKKDENIGGPEPIHGKG